MGFDGEMGRFFLICCMALALAGCSKRTAAPEERRIASLSTAAAVILNKLGTPPVAVDQYCAVAAPSTPVIGKGTAISVEKLLELKINTLILWSYQKNALEYLTRYGIELVAVDPCRAANFPELIEKLGALTGKREKCAGIISEYKKSFEGITSLAGTKKRVYLELYTRNRGAGDESYMGDLLRAAGAKSILKKSALTGTEYIVKQDPEVIFFVENFGSKDEIMDRSGFAAVEAVKRKAVYPVPRELLVEGASPREAVEYLRKRIN